MMLLEVAKVQNFTKQRFVSCRANGEEILVENNTAVALRAVGLTSRATTCTTHRDIIKETVLQVFDFYVDL